MLTVDLNADVGEGAIAGADTELLTLVSSVNIACGGHAGSRETMKSLLDVVAGSDVAAGAHPGYEDRENFGRLELGNSTSEIGELVLNQVELFAEIAGASGVQVAHVKPHGALYHRVAVDIDAATAFVESAKAVVPEAAVVGPPGGVIGEVAFASDVTFIAEGFADRGYAEDGSLLPRGALGAELDPEDSAHQVLQLLGVVDPLPGVPSGRVRSICLHGDGPDPVAVASAAREAIGHAGYRISHMGKS